MIREEMVSIEDSLYFFSYSFFQDEEVVVSVGEELGLNDLGVFVVLDFEVLALFEVTDLLGLVYAVEIACGGGEDVEPLGFFEGGAGLSRVEGFY